MAVKIKQKLKHLYRWFLAYYRLDLNLVCEMSKGKALHNDYHDYFDDIDGVPAHFVKLTCKRCGKKFIV